MTSTDTIPEPDRRLAVAFYALPVIAAALAALFYGQFWLSHDDSWYLIATRKFLDGAQIYVDIIEINPPLNFYLTVPVLWLADATGLSDTAAYAVHTCILSAVCGLWLVRILRASTLSAAEQKILLFAALACLLLLPISEWAQREHLLFVYAMPYFLHEIVGRERISIPVWERFLLGVVATFGIALKPYFLLIPAAIALVGPVKELFRRGFAPANLGLAAGLLSYALFTIVVHPGFFSDILTVAQKIYGAIGYDAATVLVRGETFGVLLFFALFFVGGRAQDPISWRFAAAVAATTVSYLVQFKGWNYHLIPLLAFLLMGTVWLAHAKAIFKGSSLVPKAVVATLVMITLGAQLTAGPYRPRTLEPLSPFVKDKGETMVVYSTNLSMAFPFVNAVEGTWASRYPAQWIVPGAVIETRSKRCPADRDHCAPFEKILDDARQSNTEDFLRYQPRLVVFDVREEKSYFHGVDFDFLEFQLEDPRFAKAWSDYEKVGEVDDTLDVWRLKDSASQ